ncbi:MAG: tRNA pseudouridine(38-40) synthase TruA [Pseudomonadota bacterium]
MRNIKLTIAYDGTPFRGWQIQREKNTVQEIVQNALTKVVGSKVKLMGSGRTDSGVHALAQVAHFLTDTKIPCEGIKLAVNNLLPAEIKIIGAEDVHKEFHSQYNAKRKSYRYLIYCSTYLHPLLINRVWHMRKKPDIKKMSSSAKRLLGEHDFTSFKGAKSSIKTSVRRLYDISVKMINDEISGEELISVTVSGEGFLKNMVRNIVGLLVEVGLSKIELSDVEKILNAKNRNFKFLCAPAGGLYLVEVKY